MRLTACALTVLLWTTGLCAQQSQNEIPVLGVRPATSADTGPTLPKIASVFRDYLRDIAELHFEVRSTIKYLKPDGTPTKTLTKKHTFEISAARLSGDEQRLGVKIKADRSTHWLQTTPDYAIFFDAFVLSLADRGPKTLQFDAPEATGNETRVTYRSSKECSAFERDPHKWYPWRITSWCGEGGVTVETTRSVPVSIFYRAKGLPLSDGKVRFESYFVHMEFKESASEEAGRVRIVPAKIVATFVTEKGKISVENEYLIQPRQ